jgi:hypothetical protein
MARCAEDLFGSRLGQQVVDEGCPICVVNRPVGQTSLITTEPDREEPWFLGRDVYLT